MLELAKTCKNIMAFTHVSTAYVNCNILDGRLIEEIVYDLPDGQDPEQLVADIIRMGPQQVAEQEKTILGTYPNTYTFTKALAERALKKNRGNLPMTILRPSIIQGNYNDPCMGWTDTIAASGFQMMMFASGLLHFLRAKMDTILDLVPCDFVSNQILAQTVFTATEPVPQLNVVHSVTTTKNPLHIRQLADIVIEYCKYSPLYRIDPSARLWVVSIESQRLWQLAMYLTQALPLKLAIAYHKIKGNERQVEKLSKLANWQQKIVDTYMIFDHFTMNTWNYMSNYSDRAWQVMSDEERSEFMFDVKTIDWNRAEQNFMFGIRRFFLKEDLMPPEAQFKQLLQKTHVDYFVDLKVMMQASKNVYRRSNADYFSEILSHEKFSAFLKSKMKVVENTTNAKKEQVANRVKIPNEPTVQKNSGITFSLSSAKAQLEEMRSEITANGVRTMVYLFNKNMRRSLQGLHVDMRGLQTVQDLVKQDKKVILMPLYKTFTDYFVQQFVNQTQDIPGGFTFGNFEDTPRIFLFDHILRKTGYILSRRKQGQSFQSNYVNSALMREVIARNQVTTIFQNAERFRAGKLRRQSDADNAVRWLLDAYLGLQASRENIWMVPVMVSHDRIYESSNLATEMVNGEKQDYNMYTSLQKMMQLPPNSLGAVYVKYLEPINLHEYLKAKVPDRKLSTTNFEGMALQLTTDLLEKHQKSTPVTLNSLVSAWILQEGSNEMTMKSLLEKAGSIFDYMQEK